MTPPAGNADLRSARGPEGRRARRAACPDDTPGWERRPPVGTRPEGRRARRAVCPDDTPGWERRPPVGTRWPQASARRNPTHPDRARRESPRYAPHSSGQEVAMRAVPKTLKPRMRRVPAHVRRRWPLSQPSARSEGHSARSEHRWVYSRSYLPHVDAARIVQGITFRLADSVPRSVIAYWREEILLDRRFAYGPSSARGTPAPHRPLRRRGTRGMPLAAAGDRRPRSRRSGGIRRGAVPATGLVRHAEPRTRPDQTETGIPAGRAGQELEGLHGFAKRMPFSTGPGDSGCGNTTTGGFGTKRT